ncbi:hypothetical protein BJV82DRAFT_403473 [Fennellomyces sp. T-0311]|nr:hypothetical protein BJV82DRAFT_403473 [Fennellomyces sp. T-0311]
MILTSCFQADEKRVEELAQREQDMKHQYNEKIRSYKEREHDLQRQLNQALDQLTQLRHTHDDTQAQLLNHNQKYDEEVVGKLAELDIVMMDLERANTKIVELERKNVSCENVNVANRADRGNPRMTFERRLKQLAQSPKKNPTL